jgi:tRNA (guanine37-N1)-methyltransferase
MRFDILTLFPEMFPAYLNASILQRAQEAQLIEFHIHNIRDYAEGRHHITDETPYGGGGGMVLKPEPIFAAVESIINIPVEGKSGASGISPKNEVASNNVTLPVNIPVILLTPQGRLFTQQVAKDLVGFERLVLLCGRYEGIDERVREHLVTDEISIGDYVLTGGELAAMVIVDAVARLVPGVLGFNGAAQADSHAEGLLEGPHYTRPETFREWNVPEVLRSGHAANIIRWRRQQALRRTWRRRPEMLLLAKLEEEDKQYLMKLAEESAHARM